MKNEKGITLISLIVTVIVLILLTTAATFTGVEVYKNIAVNNFISEMKLLQERVNLICEKYKLSSEESIEAYLISQQMNSSTIVDRNTSSGSVSDADLKKALDNNDFKNLLKVGETYYFYSDTDIANKLGIKNLKSQKVLINFNTREVISVFGVKAKQDGIEKIYYTQYDLKNGEKLIDYIEPTASPEQPEPPKRIVTNTSKISNFGQEIKTEIESNYYWIPRFAYRVTEYTNDNKIKSIEIKFLKDNSYVDLDGSNIDWTEWKISNFFEQGVGIKGMWFSIEEVETLPENNLDQDITVKWMGTDEKEVIELYSLYSNRVKTYIVGDFENRVVLVEK